MAKIIKKFATSFHKEVCLGCGRAFSIIRWRWYCSNCNIKLCASCLRKPKTAHYYIKTPFDFRSKYCKKCWAQIVQPFIDRYSFALADYENIELFSKTYKGRIELTGSTRQELVSGWYREQDECRRDLRVQSAFYGFDIVKDISINRSTSSEISKNGKGTYYFSVFQLTGTAAMSDRSYQTAKKGG